MEEKKLKKIVEYIFSAIVLISAIVLVFSLIWAEWLVFKVCATLLFCAVLVLAIREWTDIKKDVL